MQSQLNLITFLLWEGNLHKNLLLWLSVHLGLIPLWTACHWAAWGVLLQPELLLRNLSVNVAAGDDHEAGACKAIPCLLRG